MQLLCTEALFQRNSVHVSEREGERQGTEAQTVKGGGERKSKRVRGE